MANKPVRQFKTHAAPAGARGYRTRRPIRKLEGNEKPALQNPIGGNNVYTGKVGDDPGLKEHTNSAGGMLKTNVAVGNNYTLGQLLYQQQLAAANQPPPLPQPSANIPYAVDPRDLGYVPQQPQPRLLPPTTTTATIQPPLQRPVSRPAITTTNTPIGGGGFFPETPPEFVEATTRPNVGVDITPEQFTLPPQQRTVRERPPVVDYGPITTPIERPTPIDIGYTEPEPIQVEYLQPLEEPSPEVHYGELPVPQDEVTSLIDTIIPETLEPKIIDFPPPEIPQPQPQPQPEEPSLIDYGPTYGEPVTQEAYPGADKPLPTYDRGVPPAIQQPPITQPPELGMPETPYVGSEVPYIAPEIPYEGSEDIIESSADILAPQPFPSRTLDDPVVQQQDPAGGARAEDEFFMEDYHRGTDLEVGRGNIDEYVGGPIVGDPVGAAEIAEVLKPVRQQKESQEFLVDPIVDDKEEFKGGPVTSNIQGETVEYDVDPRDFQDSRDLEQQQPDPPLVDRGGQATVEDTVVDTTGQEKTQTQSAATSPPVGGRKWLHTGPQDFAEARWQLFGAAQGDPIITDTPAVSGPVVNRETGEITTEPLTWWQNRPAGSEVSPYDATTVGGTGDAGDTGSTGKSGGLEGSFTAEQVAEMAGGSITPVLDYLHPGATSDGQTVTFKDIGSVDDWIDGVIELDPTLKGLNDLVYEKKDAEGNRVGWGNHALDGFNQLTGTINKVFDFMGDPSKAEFTAAILEDFGMMPTKGSNLEEMANNFNKFRKEGSQMWETSQDKAWGRKWNALTQTQEYGDMQPMGIFALLTNPPAALAMTANSLLYDIKNAVRGMFDANPNYKGNKAQDVLNGAFHFLGKGAKKVGSLFGKLGKTIGGKLNFTSKDMKNDPMEVSRQLLYASKNADPAVGDVRYELVKTLLENGVDVRFHNNAVTFDKGVADARIDKIKTVIDNLGLSASNIEIMAGTQGLDDFPELKAWLEARAAQIRKMSK